jgi:hypothetical protein
MVTVTLSSWACQSGHWYSNDCVTSPGATFALPITFKVYNPGANDTAGSVLGTRTQTFQVPYRPSADSVHCNGSDAGKWFAGEKGCFNGLAHNITFDFSGQHIQLPNTVVYGVSYNSTHYGPNPVGESAACFASSAGCFYDSLNIGLAPKVTVGSKPHPDTIYQNSANGAEYCDGGAAGVGTMRLDSPGNACWTGYVPAARFVAGKEGGGDGNDNGGGNNGNDGGDNGDGSAGA